MLRSAISQIYYLIVVDKQKAIAGFAVAFAVSFLAQHLGYHVSDGLQQIAISSLVGLLTHIAVYLKPNVG